MKLDLERMKFGGKVIGILEDELQASINDCSTSEHDYFHEQLFLEYEAAGKPANVKNWLRERLKKRFISVAARPDWVSGQPEWLWFKGEPMVFLGELRVPENEVAKQWAVASEVIYVFAAKEQVSGGFRVEYRVVAQHSDLKGIVALVESETGPHTPANTKLVKRREEKGPIQNANGDL